MSIRLLVQLWAAVGAEAELSAYEDEVLGLLPAHGGKICMRLRGLSADGPYEIQLIEFASEAALASFMADEWRAASTLRRERVIGRTVVVQVEEVG